MKKNPIVFGGLIAIAIVTALISLRRQFAAPATRRKVRLPHPLYPSSTPTEQLPAEVDIARLAQRYWEEEGHPEGRAQEHWRRAETELRRHYSDAAYF